MSLPAVTVIVPSYNSGHFLQWTLESIAVQTMPDFECIVIDDCSTDSSIKEAKRFFSDPRFRLVTHKMNLGHSGSRNTGIRAARGEFIAFLDADDLMMANSLEVRLNTCRWGQRVSDRYAGSYCGSMAIGEDQQTAPATAPQKLAHVSFVAVNGHCPFNMNQPMVRRDVLLKTGGFNHALAQAEDFDLWIRILRAGYLFAPANFTAATYRTRTGSTIRAQPLSHLEHSLQIINSSERPLASDQLSWSRYRMSKPLSAYVAQEKKLNRTFEFIGMHAASEEGESLNEALQIAKTELPDLTLIVPSKAAVEAGLERGIRRQKSIKGPLSPKDRAKAKRLASVVMDAARLIPTTEVPTQTVYGDPAKDRVWYAGLQQQYQIIFIPHKSYHVWTISLISEALKAMGVRFVTVDISAEWRDGEVRSAAAEYGLELIALSEFVLGQYAPQAIVTFNDWDPVTRPIVVAAKAAGIKTVAIVEGIQDYDDADVHWQRYAYKMSDVVLLPGDFDKKYFRDHAARVESVGVPRIEAMRKQEKRAFNRSARPRVLINCNFSYGVLIEHRDQWLSDCVEAVRELGMTPVISRHPADTGKLFPECVSSSSFYDELERCDVTIQRFASGVLEALARDVGVIYFNPHGEKVDKFQSDPMDAYVLALTKSDLKRHLARWWDLHEMAARNGPAFLDHHTGRVEEGVANQCAAVLKANLGAVPSATTRRDFKRYMEVLDRVSLSFTQARVNNEPLFVDPSTAVAKLMSMSDRELPPRDMIAEDLDGLETVTPRPKDALSHIRLLAQRAEKPESVLAGLGTALLLNPAETLVALDGDDDFVKMLGGFVEASRHESAVHFEKVMAFARSRCEAGGV